MKANLMQNTGELPPADEATLQEILGYLNLSSGRPEGGFQRSFNRLCASIPQPYRGDVLRDTLLSELEQQSRSSLAFADSRQATAVIRLAFDEVLPAYRRHHHDLLFHLEDRDFESPFFVLRVLEAVLAQGGPWEERSRIVSGVLDHLNDFLGHRPLAVLENGRKMQPYSHERFRPFPLFIREAGVSAGRYRELIVKTLGLLEQSPEDVLVESHFDLNCLDELALDVRAYDHSHPVYRRTNYLFGEWDPHQIDTRGYYRRFVIRKIILDTLLDWIAGSAGDETERSERLYDSSAVLAGTILMASSISGSGPDTFDSSVSLATLLPSVARLRDTFYARLLQTLHGRQAARLRREAERTRQPFGHVRQFLNIHIARYGARQIQNRRTALLFARMGYPDAGRQQAAEIPSVSMRFEAEIAWRLSTASRRDTEPALILKCGREIEDRIRRGIDCGALVDPWNILGFQAQFPLFVAREDSIPDERVDVLMGIVEALFSIYARAMAEAAARGDNALSEEISTTFGRFADEWDQYATTAVSDLPVVSGHESWESAVNVARAIRGWREAGAAAGDISFWRGRVDQFHSPKAYAQVVGILLDERDHVAAMGLMMQWLSESDSIGLQSGPYAIDPLLLEWMHLVTGDDFKLRPNADRWTSIRRLFDYLEANAGDYWSVENTVRAIGRGTLIDLVDDLPGDEGEWFDDELENVGEDADEDEGNGLFEAAYDNVTYRDSTADGGIGDLLDEGNTPQDSEIDGIARHLEPRLQFFRTLAQLWKIAAERFAAEQTGPHAKPRSRQVRENAALLVEWYRRVRQLQAELIGLLGAIANFDIHSLADDPDANLRYDFEWQTKLYLVHAIISAHADCRSAERLLLGCLPPRLLADELPAISAEPAELYRGLLRGNERTVRKLIPKVLSGLAREPLLYVAPENGGDPREVLSARTAHSLFRFLLSELPRLGMLRETWQVLKTAFKAEHAGRPDDMVISEFDTLFRTALRESLLCVIRSSDHWRASRAALSASPDVGTTFCRPRPILRSRGTPDLFGRGRRDRTVSSRRRFRTNRGSTLRGGHVRSVRRRQQRPTAERRRNDLLISMVSRVSEPYLRLWFRHSRSIRLSATEALNRGAVWDEVQHFIINYGADLFHARMLSPIENIRAIVQQGVEPFLDYLAENPDPLHPMRLIEDLESGAIQRVHAVQILTIIYESLLEKVDRFVEYNTTTTQSDYGEHFYCLLDFLRLEAAYERDAWNMIPAAIVHDLLASAGQDQAAEIWERHFTRKTADIAEDHLKTLQHLESLHGMRLPSLADRLNERFVKPLAIDRMKALVPRAVQDARQGRRTSRAFGRIRHEIDAYAGWMSGSSHDVPTWLRTMEEELDRLETGSALSSTKQESPLVLPKKRLTPEQIRQQLVLWNQPLTKRSPRTKKTRRHKR